MIADIFLIIGAFFVLTGTFGIFRMKDFYSRIQVIGISDTVGFFTVIIGLLLKYPHQAFKLLFIGILILITSPVISHIIAQGASKSGIKVGGNKK
ncbi:MAG TPA: monovalent cation/H(+) antiporter subunit G [Tepiditoga sp.]|nr:monovalent cation/H(+) antiporter subunit G [Tepiditoga sp.]